MKGSGPATDSSAEAVAELARRVTAGEGAAEDELARRFGPRVLLILSARLRDRETAREAANDVLMAVIAALRAGRLREPAALPAFVHGTLLNVAKNRLRSFARRPRHEPLDGVEPHLAAPRGDTRREQLELVGRALGELEERDRQIVTLTLVDGLKPGEIAARLGLGAELVRLRKSRAVRRLAERLRGTTRNASGGDSQGEDP